MSELEPIKKEELLKVIPRHGEELTCNCGEKYLDPFNAGQGKCPKCKDEYDKVQLNKQVAIKKDGTMDKVKAFMEKTKEGWYQK